MRAVPGIHAVEGERTWCSGRWVVQTAEAFSARGSHQEGIQYLRGLQKHLIQNTCCAWRWPGALGVERRGCLRCGTTPLPTLNETSDSGLFFLEPFFLPCCPLLPCLWGVLIKVFGSLQFCNTLDAPEDVLATLVFILCTDLGLCIL